jgi:hypothetical protein
MVLTKVSGEVIVPSFVGKDEGLIISLWPCSFA